jgi:hypothetical protein
MVCPSSRLCSETKSFCTCFTSLRTLGRRSRAADDDTPNGKEEEFASCVERSDAWAKPGVLTPNLSFDLSWRGRPPLAQLPRSSFCGRKRAIPRFGDSESRPLIRGNGRRRQRSDEPLDSVRPRDSKSEIRADVAASALNERSEQGQCHNGRTAFQAW